MAKNSLGCRGEWLPVHWIFSLEKKERGKERKRVRVSEGWNCERETLLLYSNIVPVWIQIIVAFVFLFCSFLFFFFFLARICWLFHDEQCTCVLFMNPQISLFNNFFIKNGFHGTIHTFKNYFTIMFLVFSFSKISSIQTDQ